MIHTDFLKFVAAKVNLNLSSFTFLLVHTD